MSSKRLVVIGILVVLIAVGVAGFVVMRIQFNEDYANAKAAIEERQLYIIATVNAAAPP